MGLQLRDGCCEGRRDSRTQSRPELEEVRIHSGSSKGRGDNPKNDKHVWSIGGEILFALDARAYSLLTLVKHVEQLEARSVEKFDLRMSYGGISSV